MLCALFLLHMIITSVGDCGIDEYIGEKKSVRPGGISLNFAVHFKKLTPSHNKVHLLSVIGNDKDAQIVKNVIEEKKIISHLRVIDGNTARQIISIDPYGEKKFVSYKAGVLLDFKLNNEEISILKKSDLIITPLFNQIEKLFNSIVQVDLTCIKAIDFMDLSDYGKQTNIVKKYINNFDIAFFGLQISDEKIITELTGIAKNNEKIIVITLGGGGSMVIDKDNIFKAPAIPIDKIVDTTGAGDAFAAAFLSTYLETKDLHSSQIFATKYASIIVKQLGSI